jgi:hypothetical protein
VVYKRFELTVPLVAECGLGLRVATESGTESHDETSGGSDGGSHLEHNATPGSGTESATTGGPNVDETGIPDESVTYTSIEPGFADFFGPKKSTILLRDEYPAMLDHINKLQTECKNSERGVVVTGQPGIGEERTRFYSVGLTSHVL